MIFSIRSGKNILDKIILLGYLDCMPRSSRRPEEKAFLDEVTPRIRDAYRKSGFSSLQELADVMEDIGRPVHARTLEKILRSETLTNIFIFDGLCLALKISRDWAMTGQDPAKGAEDALLTFIKDILKPETELSDAERRRRHFIRFYDMLSDEKQKALIEILDSETIKSEVLKSNKE